MAVSTSRAVGSPAVPPGAGPRRTFPAVELDGLTKRFRVRRPLAEVFRHPTRWRSVHALRDVSLTVADGELHALLGQNGAGKSTLFRILATLLVPDGGRATVFGEDVVLDPAEARALVSGAAPEERSLNWRLSSVENLRLFAALYRIDRRESEQRVKELLSVVGLSEVAGRMAGQLSSGMRQRLLVARALLPRPRLLLLDEPTRSLDPLTARDLRRFLREELNEKMGITILLATHDAEEALSLSDRVSVLHHGKLIAGGPPAELASRLDLGRLHVVCRGPNAERAMAILARDGTVVSPVAVAGGDEGWVTLEVRGRSGAEAEARLLAELGEAGVEVARLERLRPGLADLLQRAIAVAGPAAAGGPRGGRAVIVTPHDSAAQRSMGSH